MQGYEKVREEKDTREQKNRRKWKRKKKQYSKHKIILIYIYVRKKEQGPEDWLTFDILDPVGESDENEVKEANFIWQPRQLKQETDQVRQMSLT